MNNWLDINEIFLKGLLNSDRKKKKQEDMCGACYMDSIGPQQLHIMQSDQDLQLTAPDKALYSTKRLLVNRLED